MVESDPFAVHRKGFQTVILAPDDGATLTAGLPVTLIGQAFHWEEPDRTLTELRWTSSRDGELGAGTTLDVLLSPGDHTITASVPDAGAEKDGFVMVTVLPDPCRPLAPG